MLVASLAGWPAMPRACAPRALSCAIALVAAFIVTPTLADGSDGGCSRPTRQIGCDRYGLARDPQFVRNLPTGISPAPLPISGGPSAPVTGQIGNEANPPGTTPRSNNVTTPASPAPTTGQSGKPGEATAQGPDGSPRRILIVLPSEFGNGVLPGDIAIVDKSSGCNALAGTKDPKDPGRPDINWGLFWIECHASGTPIVLAVPGFEPMSVPRPAPTDRYPRIDIAGKDLEYKASRKLTVTVDGADRQITLGKNWWKAIAEDRVVGDLLAAELGRPDYRGCGLKPALTIADLASGKDTVPLAKREVNCNKVELKDWPQAVREQLFSQGKCANVEPDSAGVRTSTVCMLHGGSNAGEPILLGPIWKAITIGELRSQQAPLKLLTLPTGLAAAAAPEAGEAMPKYELKHVNFLDEAGVPICTAPLAVQPGKDLAPWSGTTCAPGRAQAIELEWVMAPGSKSPLTQLMRASHKQKILLDAAALPHLSISELLPEQVTMHVEFKGGNVPDIAYLRTFDSTKVCETEAPKGVNGQFVNDERLRSDGKGEGSFELTLSGPAGMRVAAKLLTGAAAMHDGRYFQSKCGQAKIENQQAALMLDPEPSTQKSYVLVISTTEALRDWAGILKNTLWKWLVDKRTQFKSESEVAAFRLVTIGVTGTTESRLIGRSLPALQVEGVGSLASKIEFNFEGTRQSLADLGLVVANYGNSGIKRLLYVDGQKTSMTDAVAQQGGSIYYLLNQGVEVSIITIAGRCKEWKQKGWEKLECWELPASPRQTDAATKLDAEFRKRLEWLIQPLPAK